ncbi:MAG: TerC family protein [Isosphaeraceae bacterium]
MVARQAMLRQPGLASAARAELILVFYPPRCSKLPGPGCESTLDFQPLGCMMFLDWIFSIIQTMLVNVVLSGDNAMVIALAASSLPPEKRQRAMLWGTGLAIGMRMVLTFAVSYVLLIPGLRFLGAVLLAYIACKLIQEQADQAGDASQAPTSTGTAIARIALADLVMSLDNVIAIAGVAQADPLRLFLGLALSIAMILALSTAIVAIMSRFRWIVYLGTGVLALAAANMMAHDIEAARQFGVTVSQHAGSDVHGVWPLRLALVVVCLTSNYWWPRGRLRGVMSSRLRRRMQNGHGANWVGPPSLPRAPG